MFRSTFRCKVFNVEQIAEVMYRVLLRNLDYAEDYDIAELEIELEKEKTLDLEVQGSASRSTAKIGRRIRKGQPEIRTCQRAAASA